jgi:hypothetical protein
MARLRRRGVLRHGRILRQRRVRSTSIDACVNDAHTIACDTEVRSGIIQAVIPAKAGIHVSGVSCGKWIPAFAGMTMDGFPLSRE